MDDGRQDTSVDLGDEMVLLPCPQLTAQLYQNAELQ